MGNEARTQARGSKCNQEKEQESQRGKKNMPEAVYKMGVTFLHTRVAQNVEVKGGRQEQEHSEK